MTVLLSILLAVFRMVVIPVQFQDKQFTCTETELSETVLAAQNYCNEQLGDMYSFTFDLAPAVTLSKSYSYYGSNFSDRKDALLYEAVREACSLSSDNVDFSLYDNDSDGYVDNIAIIAAGISEADGASAENIWPQQGLLQSSGQSFSMNGKTINSYTVACELTSDGGLDPRPAGIGIFCHELAHSFGLPDMYDTDETGSGGLSKGLWGTSLMDTGCKNMDGNCPPNMNALDLEMLGAGTCEQLTAGNYTLEPINRSHRYLRYDTENEGEYFLFECREAKGWDAPAGGSGLLIYHVDKSDNPAGLSDYYGKVLSAAQRWEFGQINCRPDHQCAEIMSADPDAEDASGIFFPNGSHDSFGSDTNPAFRSWNGSTSGLALIHISRNSDASVSFSVVEPVKVTGVSVFQDAAIVNWTTDENLADNQGYEISWTDGTDTWSMTADKGMSSCTVEGLQPQTPYRLTVKLIISEEQKYSASTSFITKVYRTGTYPYIYLSGSSRNADGSFVRGAKIPLRIFNASKLAEVEWYFDGRKIKTGSDGYFSLTKDGTLEAVLTYEDGTRELIKKEIIIR